MTEQAAAMIPQAVIRKNDFLKRFNSVPYDRDVDTEDINADLADLALMEPAFYDLFDKGPENWTFGDITEVIKILAGTFPKWSINRILETYGYGGQAWGELEEPTKLSLIESAINTVSHETRMKAKTEYGIPLEFDGLYELHFTKDGDVKKVVLYYEEIADKIRQELGTISFKDQVFVYSEGIYKEGEAQIKAEITRTVKAIKAAKKGSTVSVKGADAEIMHYIKYHDPCTKYPFNLHKDMIPVNNGIVKLNFEKGIPELIPFSPKYKFNYKIPTDYNPNANSKPIDQILRSYVEDVKVLYQIPAQAIMQMIGYGPYKKCYLLQGRKDAGKSSYLELLYRTFGKENKSDVPLSELSTSAHRFKLARLPGKLFNIHDELASFPMKDTETLKRLLGAYSHDVEIKGMQPFEADIRCVHLNATNSPPKITNRDIKRDEAFWDKWVYVHFPYSFEKYDKFYDENFTPENMSGYLNAVIAAAIRIGKKGGLFCEYDYTEVREQWMQCSEPIYQFISDNMEKCRDGSVMYFNKDETQNLFRTWAASEEMEEEIPATKIEFSKKLDIFGIVTAKPVSKETGTQVPVYAFPYKWKPESKWKNKIKQIETKKEQAKFI